MQRALRHLHQVDLTSRGILHQALVGRRGGPSHLHDRAERGAPRHPQDSGFPRRPQPEGVRAFDAERDAAARSRRRIRPARPVASLLAQADVQSSMRVHQRLRAARPRHRQHGEADQRPLHFPPSEGAYRGTVRQGQARDVRAFPGHRLSQAGRQPHARLRQHRQVVVRLRCASRVCGQHAQRGYACSNPPLYGRPPD